MNGRLRSFVRPRYFIILFIISLIIGRGELHRSRRVHGYRVTVRGFSNVLHKTITNNTPRCALPDTFAAVVLQLSLDRYHVPVVVITTVVIVIVRRSYGTHHTGGIVRAVHA